MGTCKALIDLKAADAKTRVSITKPTFMDLIAILVIVAVTAGFVLHTQLGFTLGSAEADHLLIYHEGSLLKRLELGKNQKVELLDGKMELEINKKRVRVKKSDCRHRLCVHAGYIRHAGESVVCVPNKILLEIETSNRPELDAVVR